MSLKKIQRSLFRFFGQTVITTAETTFPPFVSCLAVVYEWLLLGFGLYSVQSFWDPANLNLHDENHEDAAISELLKDYLIGNVILSAPLAIYTGIKAAVSNDFICVGFSWGDDNELEKQRIRVGVNALINYMFATSIGALTTQSEVLENFEEIMFPVVCSAFSLGSVAAIGGLIKYVCSVATRPIEPELAAPVIVVNEPNIHSDNEQNEEKSEFRVFVGR